MGSRAVALIGAVLATLVVTAVAAAAVIKQNGICFHYYAFSTGCSYLKTKVDNDLPLLVQGAGENLVWLAYSAHIALSGVAVLSPLRFQLLSKASPERL